MDQARLVMTHAWNTAAFTRVNKLPRLRKVLSDMEPKKVIPPEILVEHFKSLTLSMGGKVIERSKTAEREKQ